MLKHILIREETEADQDVIRKINNLAFEQPQEGQVIDLLRKQSPGFFSLVAEYEGEVIGHILFTPTYIEVAGELKECGYGLAPLAVHPDHQNKGVGSLLCETGVDQLKDKGVPFILVLGHDNYYPRFGFEPAVPSGFACQWEGVPDEAFMIQIFDESALAGYRGVVAYRDEFDLAM